MKQNDHNKNYVQSCRTDPNRLIGNLYALKDKYFSVVTILSTVLQSFAGTSIIFRDLVKYLARIKKESV